MGKIHIGQVAPGMRLEREVRHRNGRLLLSSGVVLDENHLRILHTWGIREIDIVGLEDQDKHTEPPLPRELTPEQLHQAKEAVLPRFFHAGTDHPVLKELLRLAAVRKARHG